jgi:hypothetical protein
MLTACMPLGSETTQIVPPINTSVLGSTASPELTPTKTAVDSAAKPTSTPIPTDRFTPIPSFTSTLAVDHFVSSITPVVPFTDTAVAITSTPGSIGSVEIDKLPADTLYKPVRIQNSSGKQVDITLYCTTNKGFQTILEYNNVGNLFTAIPEGKYSYVIFVGGRQLVGGFSFLTARKLLITIYKDRVAIH